MAFVARPQNLLCEDRSRDAAAQSAICRQRSIAPGNRRARREVPSAPRRNKTLPEFVLDHRSAGPTRTGSSLRLLELSSRARPDPATPVAALLLFSLCWKDA